MTDDVLKTKKIRSSTGHKHNFLTCSRPEKLNPKNGQWSNAEISPYDLQSLLLPGSCLEENDNIFVVSWALSY